MQVLVVDQSRVLPGAALVLEREVTQVLSPTKHVAWLLVNQEFLKKREARREREERSMGKTRERREIHSLPCPFLCYVSSTKYKDDNLHFHTLQGNTYSITKP